MMSILPTPGTPPSIDPQPSVPIPLPTPVDWSITGKLGPVRDQGACKASYAIAVANTIGTNIAI